MSSKNLAKYVFTAPWDEWGDSRSPYFEASVHSEQSAKNWLRNEIKDMLYRRFVGRTYDSYPNFVKHFICVYERMRK